MKLLVIRHGAAMDQEVFARTGKSDDLRPLTAEGKAEMKKVALGLLAEVRTLDVLATSPLVRARQTADIVAAAYGVGPPTIVDALVPEAPLEGFEQWIAGFAEKKVVAIVGHEPHLSSLVTWLIAGRHESRLRLRKGGACLIEFDSAVRHDSGILSWLATPRQLAERA